MESVLMRTPSFKLRNYKFRKMYHSKMDCTVSWLALAMLSQVYRSIGCILMATPWTAPRISAGMTWFVQVKPIIMVPYSTLLILLLISHGHLSIVVCTHAVSWETAMMGAAIASLFGYLVGHHYINSHSYLLLYHFILKFPSI